jgi:hypothetical protein
MLLRSLFALVASPVLVFGASLKRINDFGANPTKLQMYLYVPDKLAPNPAVIAAVSEHRAPYNLRQDVDSSRSCIHAEDQLRGGTVVPSCPRMLIRMDSSSFTPAQSK